MPTPVLIDTDMGVDDAVAITLALAAAPVHVVGLVSVAGNVDLDQATTNIGRLLSSVRPERPPRVGRGLGQDATDLIDARWLFGQDGLGQADLPAPGGGDVADFREVYRELLDRHAGELVIVAIGPLTNLAALHREDPDLLRRAGRIVIMGGAVFSSGNVHGVAEFNFYRDPEAAASILSAGLPCTVVPLDATRQVILDASHAARMRASNTRTGEFVAAVLEFPMLRGKEVPEGQFLVHDALAVGVLLWPSLFLQTRIGLEIVLKGNERGRSRPAVHVERNQQVSVLVSVQAVDFLEEMIETLCHQRFVV